MQIKTLLERLDYTLLQGSLEGTISGLSHDSRHVSPGDAFLCIAGARFDAHDVVEEVAAMGASLLIVEKEIPVLAGDVTVVKVESTRLAAPLLACAYYGYPAERLTLIGITGSKGKTTTTHMLAEMLRAQGYETGTIGTNGAIFGDQLFELNNSTPDPMEMQMYLSMMVQHGCTHAVIEVSSQGMKQHRADGFEFDCGIWTNISEGDHIGGAEHKDFAEYLACKAMLIQHCKKGFVFRDDPHTDALMKHITVPVRFYGFHEDSDCIISHVEKIFENQTPGFSFSTKGDFCGTYTVHLPGMFNVANAMAAICAAKELGVCDEAINQALGHLNIKGRIDMVYRGEKFSVCVDFAHNGYSTRSHLAALREFRPKRIVCVFGADGNRSKSRRYEMGEASGLLADFSIITAGHNRYEPFAQILADIQKGIDKTNGAYIVIPDRKEAIRYAIEHSQEGDLITIIGLGHETYQEENGVKYPHSDTEFVRKTIRELGL